MDQILLSIIVPVYNVEKYIKKCLNTIIPQLTPAVELIVVDDCTPDHSGNLAKDMLSNIGSNAVFFRREENGGLSAARNSGLALARGKFCWFVDSDDFVEPTAVETILSAINQHTPDILVFNYRFIDESGNIPWQSSVSACEIHSQTPERQLELMGQFLQNVDKSFTVWRRVYSMDIIRNNDLRFEPNKEIFAEDICFNLYYLNYCKSIVKIEDILYSYLLRGDSIMGSNQDRPRLMQMHNLAKKVFDKTPHDLVRKNFHLLYAPILGIHYTMANWQDLWEYSHNISDPDFAVQMCSAVTANFQKHLAYYGKRNSAVQYCWAKTMLNLLKNKSTASKRWYLLAQAIRKI